MTVYAPRFDLLIAALRRATPFGRRRMLATHKRLIRRGIHLPSVPPGHRIIAGTLVPLLQRGGCDDVLDYHRGPGTWATELRSWPCSPRYQVSA